MIGTGIYFPLSALAFSLLMIILFYIKRTIKSKETEIYKALLLTNLIGLLLELFCTIASMICVTNPLFSDFILKSYLVYNVLWTMILAFYVLYISSKNKEYFNTSKFKNIAVFSFFVITTIIYFLECELVIENNFQTRYTTGVSVDFTYFICGILIFMMILCIIRDKKNYKNKKYYPIYIFIVTLIVGIIIQSNNPGILIITYIETLTLNIMYHTIENPDIKMLKEVYKNKELVEETYEDKSNFIFNLTQEVRSPLSNIARICNDTLNLEDKKSIKENLKVINNSVRQLDFMVNNVMNTTSLDSQKIKIFENKYSLVSLYNDILVKIKKNMNTNIKFRSNIPNSVPILYGDSIKLKQILFSLLMNSVKRTESGFIEFDINVIEKYDVCRVIFTINDTGNGMTIDKINEILSITGELNKQDIENLEKIELNIDLCQKVIKLLGGNLLIKSKSDKGTQIMMVIDQKKYIANDNNLLNKYESLVASEKKVLLICQNKKIISKLKRNLDNDDISYSLTLYGMDGIDKIKSGKEYDYVIIEDDMAEMNGYETFKKIRDINKEIPVIIILNELKTSIKEQYLKDGFNDVIEDKNLDEDLKKIINKY